MHFARLGKKKNKNKDIRKETRATTWWCESRRATSLSGITGEQTTKFRLGEFIFRQNKLTTVQKAVWSIFRYCFTVGRLFQIMWEPTGCCQCCTSHWCCKTGLMTHRCRDRRGRPTTSQPVTHSVLRQQM